MLQPLRLSHPPLVLCLLLALLGGCGTAEPGTSNSPNQELRRSFRILRTSPEHLRGSERSRILKHLSLDGSQALISEPQRAVTKYGPLWIFPTSKHLLCIAQARGGGCAPVKVARKKGVYLGVFRPPTKQQPVLHDFLVQGVVPDDVKQVVVTVGNRHTRLSVRRNIFSVKAEQPVHVKRLLR